MTDLRTTITDRAAALGWSQAELARRAGISRPNLSAYLAGKGDLNGETIGRILAALGARGLTWDGLRQTRAAGGSCATDPTAL